ncbi:MAG TPA: DNA primase [Thermoanaerobaculia bacterium]|nr:DNA primase [Thermoanaerobaculia bacterium]
MDPSTVTTTMALGNVHLTPQLVQAVRDAVDIVDVAGDHTRLQKAGHRWKGLCPLHKEKTPSFSVDPSQGLYYCFGCGKGGDAIGLHMEVTGDDFPAAIESLARRYGVPLPSRPARGSSRGGGREKPDLGPVLEAAAAFFAAELGRSDFAKRYLANRKIPPELAESYGLGFAPDGWQNLTDALRFDFGVERLEAAGLVGRSEKSGRHYDRFRNRLMFPIRNPSGRIVGFGGRTLGDDKAKYVNTAETDDFHKGSLLYGLDVAKKAIREEGRALLVEGYFDVLGAAASGIAWAVAGMGTALTGAQTKLLARFAEEVVVGYDGDDAGEGAFRRVLPTLLAEGLGVRRARFGAGPDPDSLRLAAGPEAVRRAVAEAPDAVEVELERLAPPEVRRDPRGQAAAAKEVVALLSPMPDAILRYAYARRAAERLDVPAEVLSRRLSRGAETPPRPGAPARPGPGNPPPRPGVTSSPAGDPAVPSLEDEVLTRLLEPGADPPPLERLPPEGVFFDPVTRNIYRTFHDLYRRDGRFPGARALVDALAGDDEAVARVARYQNAVEYPANCRRLGLGESIERLAGRWRKERLRGLVQEIREAQRRGDQGRLEQLLEEKQKLSQAHYRGVGGSAWSTEAPRA